MIYIGIALVVWLFVGFIWILSNFQLPKWLDYVITGPFRMIAYVIGLLYSKYG
jgi:hypothetical protein